MSETPDPGTGKPPRRALAIRRVLELPFVAASVYVWLYCVPIYQRIVDVQTSLFRGYFSFELSLLLTACVCLSPLFLFVPLLRIGHFLFPNSPVFTPVTLRDLPAHEDAACPACDRPPPMAKVWICDRCSARFDTFVHQAVCPHCCKSFETTSCPHCRKRHPIAEWYSNPAPTDFV
jgi:hypothetical protein